MLRFVVYSGDFIENGGSSRRVVEGLPVMVLMHVAHCKSVVNKFGA